MAVLHVFWGIVCDHEIYDCALISAAFYQQESTGSRSILLQQSSYAIAYHIYHQPPKILLKKQERLMLITTINLQSIYNSLTWVHSNAYVTLVAVSLQLWPFRCLSASSCRPSVPGWAATKAAVPLSRSEESPWRGGEMLTYGDCP